MFAYCRNNPAKRKDASGTDDLCLTANEDDNPFNDHGPVSGSGGAGGGGRVAGVSSSYYARQNVSTYDRYWRNSCYNVTTTGLVSSTNQSLASGSNQQTSNQHTQGTSSPKHNVNPGGSYVKMGDNGKIYSYTQFDSNGNQTLRIDFQGRPHNGVLPHIHIFSYPERGGKNERVYSLSWEQIS